MESRERRRVALLNWNISSKTTFVLLLIPLLIIGNGVNAFLRLPYVTSSSKIREKHGVSLFSALETSDNGSLDSENSETTFTGISSTADLDLARFQRRRQQFQQQKRRLPPHSSLEPKQVITSILNELRYTPYYDFDPRKPRPHQGVLTLWRACTPEWQQVMAAAVGVNNNTSTPAISINDSRETSATTKDTAVAISETQIVSALGRYFARPHQQFALLVNQDEEKYNNDPQNNYWIDFPTDVVEWGDDDCWVECRLREEHTNELLVVMGWTLVKRQQPQSQDDDDSNTAAAWYVDGLDWQDFRDAYRPGIGREEWERICG